MTVSDIDTTPAKRLSTRPVRRRLRPRDKVSPPRKADLRRAALLQAAITLLVDKGLSDSTIDEIAAQAGVAKGTFYHYFASKVTLIDALRTHFIDRFETRVIEAVDTRPADDWNGRFEIWVTTATRTYFDMHALHDLVFHGPTMPQRQAIGDIDLLHHLAALLTDGQAAGAWHLADEAPLQVAALIFHGLHGMADDALVTGQPVDELTRLIARLSRRMLVG
ncbi:TetR/AcrR family transcriptional regulator [Sphingobium aromaticiconvertens]|uniref:TetR/AcrR family transcriptional regulator n=1 Tax=Sphingobium aromaticiconvertens TaxID=365341 RepID=UPI0030184D31